VNFHIFTLFPNIFTNTLNEGVTGRAISKGLINLIVHNIRDYSTSKHKKVDDYPFGGGPGMLMKPEPVFQAVETVKKQYSVPDGTPIILMTPQGKTFTHKIALSFQSFKTIFIICGRYEGVDERIRNYLATDEISIGDFVVSGGELPALNIIDAIARLIPGVIGRSESAQNDSFYNDLLQFPQYTRPANFRGIKVPEILLSGNHEKIKTWREIQSLKKTSQNRPDLIIKKNITRSNPLET